MREYQCDWVDPQHEKKRSATGLGVEMNAVEGNDD